jgi:hypothetical protein
MFHFRAGQEIRELERPGKARLVQWREAHLGRPSQLT